jgi:hypothetical protein
MGTSYSVENDRHAKANERAARLQRITLKEKVEFVIEKGVLGTAWSQDRTDIPLY